MPERPLPIGEHGRNVAANVERLRRGRGLSLRALSKRLDEAGRPILPIGLSRLGNLQRRVDADDLVMLASVLGVTPADLLAPPGAGPGPDHAALREARNLADRVGQMLAAGGDTALATRQVSRAFRRVQIEVEELLEERAPSQRESLDR